MRRRTASTRVRYRFEPGVFARRVARAVMEVDWAPVSLIGALRCGMCILVVLAYGISRDAVSPLVPATIGLLFVCLVDPVGSEGTRIRVMAWFTVWGTLAAWVGGVVSDSLGAHLVAGAVIALAGGYAGAAGPVGQTIGMLALVLFSVFAGTPTAMALARQDALVLAAGAVAGALVIALPGLLGRTRSSRAAFARLARGLAHVQVRDPLSVGAALHATRERQFEDLVAAERPSPPRRAWFDGLGRGAHQARLAMLALAAQVPDREGDERAGVIAYLDATRRCWRQAATTIIWGRRRAGLVRAQEDLVAAHDAVAAWADPVLRRLCEEVRDGLDAIADALLAPWPDGPRSARPQSTPVHRWPATRQALLAHRGWQDPFTRHAVRLAVTFTVATVLAEAMDLPHPYWMPMTVAWISKPAMGDTGIRVVGRVAGTMVGVVVSGLVVGVLHSGEWVLVVLSAASAVLAIAFVVANYAIAVIGITTFVFFVFTLAGENMESSLPIRLAATVAAGVLVLIGALVFPTRSGARVAASLGDYADALNGYADLALTDGDPDGREDVHAAVLTARTRAVADLHAAEFEVGPARVHPETAAGVLESLHTATSQCLSRELVGSGPDDHAAAPKVRIELVALQERLVALDAGTPAPREHPPALDHPVHRSVRRAHAALDADAAHRARS